MINTNNAVKIDSKYLEIWRKPVVEEGIEEAEWERLSDIELTDNNWVEKNITLMGLQLEYLYKIRFKYLSYGKEYYMYDYNTKQAAQEYEFSTSSEVNTIGIKNLNVEFRPVTYYNKYLQLLAV